MARIPFPRVSPPNINLFRLKTNQLNLGGASVPYFSGRLSYRFRLPSNHTVATPTIRPKGVSGIIAYLQVVLWVRLHRSVYAPFYRDRSMFPFSKDHPPTDTHHAMLNTTLADQLRREIRILCVVTTQPGNHFKKAVHVKSTWGQRCTTLLFMSTQEGVKLP